MVLPGGRKTQIPVYLLVPGSTTWQLSKGFWRALLALRVDKNQEKVGKGSGERLLLLTRREEPDGVAARDCW